MFNGRVHNEEINSAKMLGFLLLTSLPSSSPGFFHTKNTLLLEPLRSSLLCQALQGSGEMAIDCSRKVHQMDHM